MATVEERVDSLEDTFARYMARTDAVIERLDRNMERMDRNIERMDRSYEELKREAREHTLQMAHIAERVGRFAEDIVAPNIPRMGREIFGITEVQFAGQRIEKRNAKDPARFREFDQLLVGQNKFIIVESKFTARTRYIDEFAEMIKELFDYFPEYKTCTVIPIFAAMALSPDFVRRLTRQKIYAMALGERTMELLNLAEVSARRAS